MARRTIVENIAHPDHDGVVGDLVRDSENGQYYLHEYVPGRKHIVMHSVPFTWARDLDPSYDATARRPQRGARETFVDPYLNPEYL